MSRRESSKTTVVSSGALALSTLEKYASNDGPGKSRWRS